MAKPYLWPCQTDDFALPNHTFRAAKGHVCAHKGRYVIIYYCFSEEAAKSRAAGGKRGAGSGKNRGRIGIPTKNGRRFFDKKVKCFFTCLTIAYNRLLRTCISACCTWFSTIPNCVGKSAFCLFVLLTKYARKGSLRPFFGRKRQKSPDFWPTATLW